MLPAFAPCSGGAVFNTAVALGRLGVPVEFFSGRSLDLFGRELRDTLAASNVGSRYAHLSPRPATLAFVQFSERQASYVFYDEGTAGRMLFEADLPELGDDVQAILFGAISLIPEPCGSTYEALRREHGPRVTMPDPTTSAPIHPDRDNHLARMERMMKMADIVKLSDEDLSWFGLAERPQDFVEKWLEQGPKLIVVTRGSKGATTHARGLVVPVAPPKVSVVDTVGAGDTFNAGLLASLHAQGALTRERIASLTEAVIRSALELAAKAAAVTVSRAGANPAPWEDELG